VEALAPGEQATVTTLSILEWGRGPYAVEVSHGETPDGSVRMHVFLPDGYLGLVFSPEERRSWGSLCWRTGEAVDAWHREGAGAPRVFTQTGLRYQLQDYVHDRVMINENTA